MLKSVILKFTESPDVILPCTGVTIFVGPNNSGKRLFLKELESLFLADKPVEAKIIKDFNIDWPSETEFETICARYKPRQATTVDTQHRTLRRVHPSRGVEQNNIDMRFYAMKNHEMDKYWLAHNIGRFGLLRLDGRSRFELTKDQNGGDLTQPPENILSHLFSDDGDRLAVRDLVFDAFKINFVVDPSTLGSLRVRLSSDSSMKDEQSLNSNARKFYSDALYIKDASDGV